jgi:hypothetical protein
MENIVSAPSRSAVGQIWLSHAWNKKQPKKLMRPFLLFSLNLKYELLLVMVSINFF